MSLVERLGFQTLDNLYKTMDSYEIMEWMALDLIRNPETRKILDEELEKEKVRTPEETTEAIVDLFTNLRK